ncbi:DUF1707 domain-containing protein [Streptosporangium sp. NPDC001559]|uniref:DUF1707 SHOCT-like domain-containing protein n=1 Tax=Streptosporangium sp. NPDC001559 TaxID=3366187 RepID=UPI0036E784F2
MTFPDDLRIGDAEREAAMESLREHYAQGRLNHEEFEERLDVIMTARTGRDLARAGADLPDLPGMYGFGATENGGPGAVAEGDGERWDHHSWDQREWRRQWRNQWREARRLHRHAHHGWSHSGQWQQQWQQQWNEQWRKQAALQRLTAQRWAATRHHRPGHHRGGAAFVPVLIGVVALTAIMGFGVFKILFLAWIVMAVAGVLHRKHWHHRMGHGRR